MMFQKLEGFQRITADMNTALVSLLWRYIEFDILIDNICNSILSYKMKLFNLLKNLKKLIIKKLWLVKIILKVSPFSILVFKD